MINRMKIIFVIAILLITFPYFVFANTIPNIPQTPQEMIVYPYENPDVWWVYGITGSLDDMLAKVAGIYEQQVDDAVDALSSLIEPLIMVVLGILVGGLVIAMYLPIFKLGSVIH